MNNHNKRSAALQSSFKSEVGHHQFACYYANLSSRINQYSVDQLIRLDNALLAHRIFSVLRMRAGESLVLFDQTITITLLLTDEQHKKSLSGIITQIEHSQLLIPAITVLLPVLKREALEDALYSCVELGATAIQLIITTKTHKTYLDEKQLHRLQAILIAAAEQSKNFAFPTLSAPVPVQHLLPTLPPSSIRLLFHADGTDLLTVAQQLNPDNHIIIMIGPEGDCTQDEKKLLQAHHFILCKLTPTVLRSQQALAVGLGALRSLVKPK